MIRFVQFFVYQTGHFLSPPLIAAEWVLVAMAVVLMVSAPRMFVAWLRPVRAGFCAVAYRKRLAILICGLLPIVIRLSMLGFAPVPYPSIHDEFSHLLLGDTLAHGRLTNPTHPLWQHFESIHIIQQPTYNSMYPPAQGAFLALGQAIFHQPWAGVVISVGLMCAAICWMMQQWLPPAWAFFGTLIVVMKIGVTGFWMNSYMGGAVSAIAGALLIGSARRLRRFDSRPIHAALFGLGFAMLVNSRPFEGGVLSAAAAIYVLPQFVRRLRKSRGYALRVVLLPAAMVAACGLLFTGYYSWRVTGSPLRMPYQVNRATYGWPENLAFLPAEKVTFRHKALEDMYLKEVHHRDQYRNGWDFALNLVTRVFDSWTVFIGPTLTAALVFLPFVFRDRRTRPLMIFLIVIAALNLLQMVLYPFHLGPVVPILFAIVVQGVRHIYVGLSQFSPSRGLYFAAVLPACLILTGALKQNAAELDLPLEGYWERAAEPHRDARGYIQSWLEARPRKQLVVVRYAPYHSPDQEWVYNRADIDGSKVVWAREMDAQSDAQLLRYFAGRETWLLQADVYPPRVVPYTRSPLEPAIACNDE